MCLSSSVGWVLAQYGLGPGFTSVWPCAFCSPVTLSYKIWSINNIRTKRSNSDQSQTPIFCHNAFYHLSIVILARFVAISPVWYGQISVDKPCKWQTFQFAGWYPYQSQYQCPHALKRHRQSWHHKIEMADVEDVLDAFCGDFDIVWTNPVWK